MSRLDSLQTKWLALESFSHWPVITIEKVFRLISEQNPETNCSTMDLSRE